jgi:hypothetical protein
MKRRMDGGPVIDIHTAPGASGLTLTTRGLAARGRRELEIVAVEREVEPEAKRVLALLADQVAGRRPLTAGELLAVGLDAAAFVVRVVEPPSGCGWPRAVTTPLPALRVVAPTEDAAFDEPPNDAIATLFLERAESGVGDGERELERCIELFPGDPKRRALCITPGRITNHENHLSYFALACRRGRRGRDLYAAALARSAELEASEAGASETELARLDGGALDQLARTVLRQNLGGTPILERAGATVAVFVSPFWRAGDKGRVVRESSLLPMASLSLYYDGAARRALEHPEVPHLVAAVVLAHRDAPSELLVRTWPARVTWLDPRAPVLTTSEPCRPGQGAVSLVLAQLGLLASAGVERSELSTAFGLDADERTARSIEDKLARLDARIAAWQTEALSEA